MSFDESDELVVRRLLKSLKDNPGVASIHFNEGPDSETVWPVTVTVFAKGHGVGFAEAVLHAISVGHPKFKPLFEGAYQTGPHRGFALRFPFKSANGRKIFMDGAKTDGLR